MTVKRAKRSTRALKGVKQGKSSKIRGITHKMFVEAYISNKCNGRAAMMALGAPYSTSAARASAFLRVPEVIELIKARQEEVTQNLKLSSDEVLNSLARAIRFDPRLLFDERGVLLPIHQLPDEIALELEGWENSTKRGVKIDFPKKHAARDQAMKFFGLFAKDKQGARPEDEDAPPPAAVTIDFKDARRKK